MMWLPPLLAVLTLCGAATLIPTRVSRGTSGTIFVTLRGADMQLRAADPSRYPFFSDVLLATEGSRALTVTLEELTNHLDSTSGERGRGLFPEGSRGRPMPYASPQPAGFVFHEARVGSTLAANS